MEMRCHTCGERFQLDAAKTGQEIACPKCGVTLVVPSRRVVGPGRVVPALSEVESRPTQQTLKRIFEPIPRSAAYLVGVVLILVVLSPFWVFLLKDRFVRSKIVISNDVQTNPLPPLEPYTNISPPVLDAAPGVLPDVALSQYRGVRLDATREDLQRRFNLRLVNTRGMVPEIYQANKIGDVEQMTAHFYNNMLKELSLVLRSRTAPPDVIEKELRDEFGEPKEVSEQTEQAAPPIGGLVGAIGAAPGRDELEARLAAFPFRRYVAWDDERNHVDATIYYTSTDPAQCTSVVTVRMSAAQWLDGNRPHLGAVSPPPASLAEQTNAPPPEPEVPRRLFP